MPTTEQPKKHYNRLRQFLGYMGFALPLILFTGSQLACNCGHLQDSISAYYYTNYISVFCGLLITIGIFLFTYTGSDKLSPQETRIDRVSTNIAGLLAIGVATFPTTCPLHIDSCNTYIDVWWCGTPKVHIACAISLFITLAFISLCVFTKTDPANEPKPAKLLRNGIYKVCGWAMVSCLGLAAIVMWFEQQLPACLLAIHPIFILETAMLFAFGTSWLIKGEALFGDESRSYQLLPQILKPMPKHQKTKP